MAITANTVYVASYHTNVGHYSDDLNYFATQGVDNPPLHALANGVSGGNGVYATARRSSFPNQELDQSSNYWVDVVFTTTAAATDRRSGTGRLVCRRYACASELWGFSGSVSSIYTKMIPQNLAVISLLADMGNGEVQNPVHRSAACERAGCLRFDVWTDCALGCGVALGCHL